MQPQRVVKRPVRLELCLRALAQAEEAGDLSDEADTLSSWHRGAPGRTASRRPRLPARDSRACRPGPRFSNLAAMRRLTGDYPRAAQALDEALSTARDLGDPHPDQPERWAAFVCATSR